jgi:hypothetical protein
MSNAVIRVVSNRKILKEAAYAGNIGIMELIKFKSKATPEQKKKFDDHVKNKKHKDAWKLVQDVTGVKLHKSVTEAVYHGDWVRHPDNPWQVGQIQNIKNDQAEVMWKKIDKRKKAVVSTHHVKDLQHARREFSQLNQPTHHKEMVSPDILPPSGAGNDATDTLVNTYKNDTPGQNTKKVKRFKDFK